MNKPEHITFTGIDDRTDLDRAARLAEKFPIEWGILVSKTNRDARYPCLQTINDVLSITGAKSIHICGEYASHLAEQHLGDKHTLRFIKLLLKLAVNDDINRIQINNDTYLSDTWVELTFSKILRVPLIRQWRYPVFNQNETFQMLYDCSGGTGKAPEMLPRLLPGRFVGYAGGINPTNVLDFLNMIEGTGTFWIDMETGVRTNGWFDLDKVEDICLKVFR